MAREVLPESLWEEARPLLPPHPPPSPKGGRLPVHDRAALASGVNLGRAVVGTQLVRGKKVASTPALIFGDRAYGTAAMIALVLSLGIGCFLARRNS